MKFFKENHRLLNSEKKTVSEDISVIATIKYRNKSFDRFPHFGFLKKIEVYDSLNSNLACFPSHSKSPNLVVHDIYTFDILRP